MTTDRSTVPPPRPEKLLTDEDARAVAAGTCRDPFATLGPTADGTGVVVRIPGASAVEVVNDTDRVLLTEHPAAPGVFVGPVLPFYRLRITWPGIGYGEGSVEEREDPYRFGPVIGELDEYLIGEGRHRKLWTVLGAHLLTHEGVDGVHFAVWAPNATRVSVVGDHNGWDATAHPMRPRGATGVWELFLPGLADGAVYKYDILGPHGEQLPQKADPVGFGAEPAPATGSVVRQLGTHTWADGAWMADRADPDTPGINDASEPVSIFEVHLGSWRRHADGTSLSYRELAEKLVDYVADLGFTHIEVLPVSEYPFPGSWGYQPIGLYAPTNRYGTPGDFAAFVDAAHAKGLGVLADWVPGHFPTDAHGLGRFDGTALYEHLDPRRGFHPDWTTWIFNYGRPEVADYLSANALYWLEEYHLDGLRVDAVSSVVYRDYSRRAGDWVPNDDGGRENYEGIDFLRDTTTEVAATFPGTAMVAEESTTYPGVTAPVGPDAERSRVHGLGFDYKWNLGWMNDSLEYFGRDPLYRRYHHNQLTFGLTYAFTESFVLPISHDEVVHGKGSMYGRMPGTHDEKMANLKAFYGYMWGYPGKKLLFMGTEFGQVAEWNFAGELEWNCLDDAGHTGVQSVVRDLNLLYREQPALHRRDCDGRGFQWLVVDDNSGAEVYAWLRRGLPGDPHVVVVLNLTPVERTGYRVPFPVAGRWIEALNTDSEFYAGGNRGNTGAIQTEAVPVGTEAQSAMLTLPPLSAIFFVEDLTFVPDDPATTATPADPVTTATPADPVISLTDVSATPVEDTP
ncbi:1,4-alpha-glucan branching protein GlgB [Corynebacterium terpenotabidum]|uniref:1,4-alpha-glucan branching enzyme GlgB n=1 Tax=Corynebacterium terpenotabidum Y-11 TaxID=1200352 RepID=S4XAT9_9CORY|nr:1,4-alpha-glucan branching protein GlgB [Corynebacterium terpenotabidum]AGP30252.1 glycogen branching enzyme [Corynebacterium terpenotabidum Y-11]